MSGDGESRLEIYEDIDGYQVNVGHIIRSEDGQRITVEWIEWKGLQSSCTKEYITNTDYFMNVPAVRGMFRFSTFPISDFCSC